jgi:hypothetical protein
VVDDAEVKLVKEFPEFVFHWLEVMVEAFSIAVGAEMVEHDVLPRVSQVEEAMELGKVLLVEFD